ncbi:MAG TPA: RIO1 family regulatory kinase/ATPase [Acidimicrobiales bacterium]|nr:RIO1 family regulatory kinase/ATPase [Acidimicrobiales bacterium]
MPSRDAKRLAVIMAAKRNTEDFERMARSLEPDPWDDDQPDLEATTYLGADHGPDPVPDWVIVSGEARQSELGLLKTGKEADVHLVERRLGDQCNVLAAKRYRKFEDRLFRNDARYRAGRRTGESRLDKAMAEGNKAGMAFRARMWLSTEFEMLSRLWSAGVAVPYPVQKLGNELMLELIGSPEEAAPRLVHARLDGSALRDAWSQLVDHLHAMLRCGVVHGDLSPYNVLWDRGRLVIIDFPQAVDPIAHPEGISLLERDIANVADWFGRRGVACDAADLFTSLLDDVFHT